MTCLGMNVETLCPRLGMVGGVAMAPLSNQNLVNTPGKQTHKDLLYIPFNLNSEKLNK